MANFVIKKNRTKEPFNPEKIKDSITAACQNIVLPEERTNEIVEQVSATIIQAVEAKEEITTSEIKENILNQLDELEPSVSAAWRKYEEIK